MASSFPSNLLAPGSVDPGRYGQTPIATMGTVVIPDGTTLDVADRLPLCLIPDHTMLVSLLLVFPAVDSGTDLVFALKDKLAPTTYISGITAAQAGGIVTQADLETGGIIYQDNQQLDLVVTTGAGAAASGDQTIFFAALFARDW